MNRLQLATLLSWAGADGIKGRKRMQKVVFFLQHAGCSLDCQYTLHHFGPYSRDVVDACDDLVAADLIVESGGPNQYCYSIKPGTVSLLDKSPDANMARFQPLAVTLINEDNWLLELGSTILYFFQQLNDWDKALEKACLFKQVQVENPKSKHSLSLAKRISEIGASGGGQSLSRPAV